MAAAYRVDARRWSALFGELMDPIEARFSRPEPRRRVRDFVNGLLAPLPTKNCWTIAEHAGDVNPGGMQDLIGRETYWAIDTTTSSRCPAAGVLTRSTGIIGWCVNSSQTSSSQAEGRRRLRGYIAELAAMTGQQWTGVLDVYKR